MSSRRQHVSTGSPFEPKVGISRAVRAGKIIAVTGTAPLSSEGKTVAKGDAAGQARRCLEIIQSAIRLGVIFMRFSGPQAQTDTRGSPEIAMVCSRAPRY